MSDKMKFLPLIGLGYLLTRQSGGCEQARGAGGAKYKTYKSGIYDVSFEYPAHWVENKNYSERYEGTDGFFEVADIRGIGRTIDEVTAQEIDSPISPYGTNPQVESFLIDGEPARLILPSLDQAKVFGREAAFIVKNKMPIVEGKEAYDYTIIWSDLRNMDHIIKTFKFA